MFFFYWILPALSASEIREMNNFSQHFTAEFLWIQKRTGNLSRWLCFAVLMKYFNKYKTSFAVIKCQKTVRSLALTEQRHEVLHGGNNRHITHFTKTFAIFKDYVWSLSFVTYFWAWMSTVTTDLKCKGREFHFQFRSHNLKSTISFSLKTTKPWSKDLWDMLVT